MRTLARLAVAVTLLAGMVPLLPLPMRAFARQDTNGPGPRSGHSLVYDAVRRRLVLVDGYLPPHDSSPADLWSWDGRQWDPVPGSGAGPAKRIVGAAAYDARRDRIVSFGGSHSVNGTLGDTWEWDGAVWRERVDTTVGRRDHHALVYDTARSKAVLFGGNWGPPPWPTDTWEWDGTSWTRAAVDGPAGRSRTGMVYDSVRKQVVLFGGVGAPPGPKQPFVMFGDMWTWNGAVWRRLHTESPPARYAHAMAFDSRRGVVVMYGGAAMTADGQTAHLEDLWEWDGNRWREIAMTGRTPGKRYSPAMAYDIARDRVVLTGGLEVKGRGQFTAFDDVWEWNGSAWERAAAGTGMRP
jgi:hypothetical protein